MAQRSFPVSALRCSGVLPSLSEKTTVSTSSSKDPALKPTSHFHVSIRRHQQQRAVNLLPLARLCSNKTKYQMASHTVPSAKPSAC